MSFYNLPDLVLSKIFNDFTFVQLIRYRKVCKFWKSFFEKKIQKDDELNLFVDCAVKESTFWQYNDQKINLNYSISISEMVITSKSFSKLLKNLKIKKLLIYSYHGFDTEVSKSVFVFFGHLKKHLEHLQINSLINNRRTSCYNLSFIKKKANLKNLKSFTAHYSTQWQYKSNYERENLGLYQDKSYDEKFLYNFNGVGIFEDLYGMEKLNIKFEYCREIRIGLDLSQTTFDLLPKIFPNTESILSFGSTDTELDLNFLWNFKNIVEIEFKKDSGVLLKLDVLKKILENCLFLKDCRFANLDFYLSKSEIYVLVDYMKECWYFGEKSLFLKYLTETRLLE